MPSNPAIAPGETLTIPIGYQPNLSAYTGTGYRQGYAGWDGLAGTGYRDQPDNFPTSCTWVVDDSTYAVWGQYPTNTNYETNDDPSGGPNGWNVSQMDASHLSITVPSGQALGTSYVAYFQQSDNTYHYAVFDVVAASARTTPVQNQICPLPFQGRGQEKSMNIRPAAGADLRGAGAYFRAPASSTPVIVAQTSW